MARQKKYSGVVVPMVTPFTLDGDIDLPAAERIVEHIVASGACVFALGTTGEGNSISLSTKAQLIETVVKKSAGRAVTYAGISDSCLATSVEMAEQFFDLGADVVVAHVPSYYPLTDDDILSYYEELADGVPGPLMLYNIPVTTGVSVPLEVIDRLSHLPTVVGLKDSARDVDRLKQAVEMWKGREDFSYLIGCTSLSTTALSMGADGIVTSVGNIVPGLFGKLYDAVLSGDMDEAERYQRRADDIGAVFQKERTLSQSLSALKAVMHVMGLCGPKMLPPLRDLTAEQIQAVREAADDVGLLEEDHSL